MKKYIMIDDEAMDRLESGERIECSMKMNLRTKTITLTVWRRTVPKQRQKDRLVKKLPWGWVKESIERVKVFGSFPKDMGTAAMMGQLDEHHRDAKNALIDRELDLIEFC